MDAKQAKRILLRFRILVVLTTLMLLVSFGSNVTRLILTDQTYKTYVGISTATGKAERIQTYKTAIRLIPGRPDAYLRLLETYAEDGIFEKPESEEFLALYNAQHIHLDKKADNYPTLLQRIGFLYINGFPDATTTCLRMALPFLKEANALLKDGTEEKRIVECYCRIGSYYEEYIWDASSVREISVPVMEEMITGIETTLADFQNDTSADAVFNSLGFGVAVCNLFYDQRDILAATIAQDRVTAILDTIYESLPDGEALRKVQTQQLLQTLQDNKSTYYDMIGRAYTRKGG